MPLALISAEFAAKSGKAAKALNTLRATCKKKLQAEKIDFTEFCVPGAFEIPSAAQKALAKKKFAGVIALGIIVRGETIHFELVAENCARKLADLSITFNKPVIFGVLATESRQQAEARARQGAKFATAALQMLNIFKKI